MPREQNLKNLKTEKQGLDILLSRLKGFKVPSVEEKRMLYSLCGIDYRRFARSIDGIVVKVKTFDDIKSHEDFLFVEVKTTKSKDVTELPYGAFFGFTQNEEALFKSLVNYRLCIVHTILEDFYLLDYSEYESMISRKRVQYQINFKRK